MSTFSSIEASKRALAAQRLGLDITGSNISNVNTTGYSRRQAVLSEVDTGGSAGGFQGTGVVMNNLRNFREELFDKEIRNNISRQSGFDIDESMVNTIESIMNEPSDAGLNEQITKFFNAFQDLSSNPENIQLRNTVLDQAKSLIDQFHGIASKFEDTRIQVASDLNTNVGKINSLLKDIADLNSKTSSANAQNSPDTQTYIDQRESKIEELAQLTGVNVTQGDFGTVNVFINGINVVTGVSYTALKLQQNVNASTGEKTMQLINTDNRGNVLNYINPTSGETASQLKHYNVTLNNLDSSGGFSVYKKLDDLASALVQKVNGLTVGGYGLDDTGTTPPGRNFFNPSVGNATALTISLSTDVANARDIPLSDTAGEQGNNKVALKLAQLSQDGNFIDNQSVSDFVTSYIGKIGSMGNEATNGKSSTKTVGDQLANQRESVIGVNLDEEAVNLIKFQKAFEASSRVVNTLNEILSTIVNLGK